MCPDTPVISGTSTTTQSNDALGEYFIAFTVLLQMLNWE